MPAVFYVVVLVPFTVYFTEYLDTNLTRTPFFLIIPKERTVRETEIQTIQRKVIKFTDACSEKCKKIYFLNCICTLNNICLCLFSAATGEARERSRCSDDPKKGKKIV